MSLLFHCGGKKDNLILLLVKLTDINKKKQEKPLSNSFGALLYPFVDKPLINILIPL